MGLVWGAAGCGRVLFDRLQVNWIGNPRKRAADCTCLRWMGDGCCFGSIRILEMDGDRFFFEQVVAGWFGRVVMVLLRNVLSPVFFLPSLPSLTP